MIASVHIADVGPRAAVRLLRSRLAPGDIPGLRWGDVASAAPFRDALLVPPKPGRVGLIAFWVDDGALDRFLDAHPLARRLGGGWHARMAPLRASGAWAELPELASLREPAADGEPVAVITLGRLRLARAPAFLRANRGAMGQAVTHPGMLASTGLARPPRLVATFSLWTSLGAMRDYAYRQRSREGHLEAVQAHNARPFHSQSTFIRLRPYASGGDWAGRNPLEAAAAE